jgi:O-antigen/teichoic acid export membrane protein
MSNEGATLRRRTTRGALVASGGQVASLGLRLGTLAILARILAASDFGLVGMVATLTGFLTLFRDVGLSVATVQRARITHEQTSTLFWVNLALGGALFIVCAAAAPLLSSYFHEPRLISITFALGIGFLFNGAMVQHRALMQRDMRFGAMSLIDITALVLSSLLGVAAALNGAGYWALVLSSVALPGFAAVGFWFVTRWRPGPPVRGTGVRSMLMFGGKLTWNSMVVYFAYNVDKMLVGRVFGADALGLYGRAYQLINLPTDNLGQAISQVALPALARLQNEPVQLRDTFLHGYASYLSLVFLITTWCAVCAGDIVLVLLGPKWHAVATIFQLLAPTVLVLGIINPFGWMMMALGFADRSLKLAYMIAPTVILGYAIGSQWGTEGVAAGFSTAMVLLVVPFLHWAKRGTLITYRDLMIVLARPLVSAVAAGVMVLFVNGLWTTMQPGLLRLLAQTGVLFTVYVCALLALGWGGVIGGVFRRAAVEGH